MLNAEDRNKWEQLVAWHKDHNFMTEILAVAAHLAEVEGENERLRNAFEYAEDVFMGTIPELPLWLESTVALAELRRRAEGKE